MIITEHESIYPCECGSYIIERAEYGDSKYLVRCKNCHKAISGNIINFEFAKY